MRLDVRVACFYMQPWSVYQDLDVRGISRIVWLRLVRESTYMRAHIDLVGDPLQGTCHARASEILITKVRKIFYLGFHRIFP